MCAVVSRVAGAKRASKRNVGEAVRTNGDIPAEFKILVADDSPVYNLLSAL